MELFKRIMNMPKFPSPTGVTYYEYDVAPYDNYVQYTKFPSPTGVTYYESFIERIRKELPDKGFRPQQGLPIMNTY